MFLRYRLEFLLVVLLGMLMHANHLMLTCMFLGLTFLQISMSIVVYKNLLSNQKRLKVLVEEKQELNNRKKTFKEKFLKIEFWLVVIGIIVSAFFTQSIFVIIISLFVVALELGKIYTFKRLEKNTFVDV
jgi:hypothetical protein